MDLPPDSPMPRGVHGRSWIDLVVAFSVIFISLVSLFIALRQNGVMQKQLEATVWPYLQFDNSNYDPEQREAAVYLALENVGVGPARIVALNLNYDGKALRGHEDLIAACCNPEHRPVVNILSSGAAGHVLPANRNQRLFRLRRAPEDDSIWQRLNVERHKITGTVCYCSLLDQCYVSQVEGDSARPVVNCEDELRKPQYAE